MKKDYRIKCIECLDKEYREKSDDVLKRVSLLDEECRNSPEYAADNESILLIIRDIAREAHTALTKKSVKEAHEREHKKEESCTTQSMQVLEP